MISFYVNEKISRFPFIHTLKIKIYVCISASIVCKCDLRHRITSSNWKCERQTACAGFWLPGEEKFSYLFCDTHCKYTSVETRKWNREREREGCCYTYNERDVREKGKRKIFPLTSLERSYISLRPGRVVLSTHWNYIYREEKKPQKKKKIFLREKKIFQMVAPKSV